MRRLRVSSQGLVGVLAFAAVAGCLATASAQTTLRWKFQPGQVFDQTITQEIKTTISVGGQTYPNTVTQIIEASSTVGRVDAQGTAEVTQQIKRIRMKLSGTIQGEIDSASDAAPQGVAAAVAPAVKAMAGAQFDMRMNTLGEILDVEVSSETLEALQKLPNAQQMGDLLGKDGLVNMIKKGAPAMPEQPVQRGSKWSNTMELAAPQFGKMVSLTTLTYLGPADVGGKPLEQIALDVTIKLDSPPPAGPSMSIKDQSAKGTLYFDNNAGHIDHSDLVQDVTMQLAVADKRFDQRIQTSVRMEFKPAGVAKP